MGRPPYLTPEQREASRIKQNRRRTLATIARRKARRAAAAAAKGRVPGQIGGTRIYSDEERKRRRVQATLRVKAKNPEKVRKAQRIAARKKRAEGRVAKRKRLTPEYRAANRDKLSAHRHARRARVKGVGGKWTPDDIKKIRELQKDNCAFCLKPLGAQTPHVDHYIPIRLGGANDRSNLRLLHPLCNRKKSAKHPIDFALENGMLCF